MDQSSLKNANDQYVGQVLAEILNNLKFPSYELQSEDGSEVTIRDIESKESIGVQHFIPYTGKKRQVYLDKLE